MNKRESIVAGLQAIAAGLGVSIHLHVNLEEEVFVQTVQENDSPHNPCSVNYWKEKGKWKSKIGWFSSSSSDTGPEPCITAIQHMNCALAMTNYLRVTLQ